MNSVITYAAPQGAALIDDYRVRVRAPEEMWQEVAIYKVKVDMHDVREASMASFDMQGTIEVEITYNRNLLKEVIVRPLSQKIECQVEHNIIRFNLHQPKKLIIECNDERFNNLHLFANEIDENIPDEDATHVLHIKAGIHRVPDIVRQHSQLQRDTQHNHVWYFAPGMHYIEETVLRVPSSTTIYLAGGAVLVGSIVCDHVKDVVIRGRGHIYLADFHRFSAFRGIRITNSQQIKVEGVTVIDPPHYSIFIGQSKQISISNFKAFSTRGWSDGIDMMASEDIEIDDVFMRNSDDCIAVYGSRWDFYGGSKNITVKNAILWADVAHPIMIGVHGDHHGNGDVLEYLRFENIEILEHHEIQPNYWGAMAINAGDFNTVRHVVFENIRVERIEEGQLFDIRVVHNMDYNPHPGNRIDNIVLKDIYYAGGTPLPSRIHGFNHERIVEGITIDNLVIGGERIESCDHPALDINEYAHAIQFVKKDQDDVVKNQ